MECSVEIVCYVVFEYRSSEYDKKSSKVQAEIKRALNEGPK